MSREHDAPEPRKAKQITPGRIPANRIGVYDREGNLRGNVGHLASAATASRFTKTRDMKLGTMHGRTAWVTEGKSK